MPITSKHPEYKRWAPRWLRCRHFVEGEDAVKGQGLTYLPALDPKSMMTMDEQERYSAYKTRATFYGATARTVEALVGAAFRKEPTFTVPDRLKDRLEDITGTGISASEMCKLMVAELLTTGRLGLLVDKAQGQDAQPATVAMYNAENITNWLDGGARSIVLQECELTPKANDPYELEERTVYRELCMVGTQYTQRIHKPKAGGVGQGATYEVANTIVPLFRGREIVEIPFVFVSPRGVTETFGQPPILPLVNLNLSHYQLSADYDHGLHWTALPTPWFTGVKDSEKGVIALGPQGGIILEDGGSAGMLEFTGQGLKSVENGLSSKEAMMATLGAQLFRSPKGVEASDTAKIHQSGQTATLHTVVQAAEEGMEKALQYIAMWEGIDGADIEVEINREFIELVVDPALMDSLFKMWQGGGIDLDTFLYNVKRFGLAHPDDTVEDIKQRIDKETADAQALADKQFENQQKILAVQGDVQPTPGPGDQGAE